jgi:hypothetical protein
MYYIILIQSSIKLQSNLFIDIPTDGLKAVLYIRIYIYTIRYIYTTYTIRYIYKVYVYVHKVYIEYIKYSILNRSWKWNIVL